MFRTLRYFFERWLILVVCGRSSNHAFNVFLKILKTEVKCIFITGYSMDELYKK